MNRYGFLFIVWLILAGLKGSLPLYSQEIINPESEYTRIRTIAINGDFETAVNDARKLVNACPGYGDARILLGRILGWQKNYENALAVIDTLLLAEPDNHDALEAKSDILRWSQPVKNEPDRKTGLQTGYSFDTFTEPYSRFWQIFSAGAGHKFIWGSASASLNTGYIITGAPAPLSQAALQAEAEAYPVISKKNYAFLSYAFSPGNYFPKHRAAVEVWQTLPAGWAVSAGLNFYYFDRNIFIACSSVEKYAGKYWFSLKGFLYFKDEGPTTSGYLNARRYFNDYNYLQITVRSGTAPDEPFDVQADLMRLSANGIRISFRKKLSSSFSFNVGAGYSVEEYAESVWRNRFEGNATLTYSFKSK